LSFPGLIATGVFSFITSWNDFICVDIIMSQDNHQTLAVWLFGFVTNTRTDYGGLMASCTLFDCRSWSSSLSCNDGWSPA
jgi:ABC-type glycerol-3-phosphate transport system permease component